MKELKFDQFDRDIGLVITIDIVSPGKWKVSGDSKDQLLWRSGDVVEAVATGETFFRKSDSGVYCFSVAGLVDQMSVDDSIDTVLVGGNAFKNVESMVCVVTRIK